MNRRGFWIAAGLVLTTFIWGSAFTGIKLLLFEFEPMDLAVARFLLAAPGFLVTLAWMSHRRGLEIRLTRRQAIATAIAGLLGVVGYHTFLNIGGGLLTQTQSRDSLAVLAGFLISTNSLFTILLVPFITREHLGPRRIAGVLVGLVGTAVLLLWGRGVLVDAASLLGMLLILGAPLCWALYSLILKRFLAGVPLVAVTAYAMLFGTVFLLPLASDGFISTVRGFGWKEWAWLFHISVLSVFAAYCLWGWALEHWDSSRVASFVYLVPLFSTLTAVLIGGELLTWQLAAGGALILLGVWTANSSRRAPMRMDPVPFVEP